MAEKSTSKNQQFLQQFERQRLNKPCNRIIDLRGKVAGECQAYTFGGKTHYLDDRAYLLAKQLLDHFNGRYTMGVYEAVLKALKSLSADNITHAPSSDNDELEVQILPFNQRLHRKEPRIIYTTPIEIRIADVLYHGATIDITTSAISISLKRTYTLEKGDEISVTFPELTTTNNTILLSKISYTIIKINHDELRTQLILTRNRNDNNELSEWFDRWSQHHNSGDHLDIDNDIFNLTTHYYLRLYCHTLNSALFWLNHNDKAKPIKAFHMNQGAENSLQNEGRLDFSILPFERIIAEKCDFLLLTVANNNSPKHYLVRRDNTQDIAHLLNWHSQQTDSHLFLIQTQNISVDLEKFKPEIECVAKADSESARVLKQRLVGISHIATVTNITHSCQHLTQANNQDEPLQLTQHWDGFIPVPTEFKHHIQREHQRFVIRTNIHLHSPNENRLFNVITTDVSGSGLSISLPGDVDLKVGSRVSIDFVRWQSQTDKIDLTQLPYIVRNKKFRSGASHLGLERDVFSCDISINKFFITTIEKNKEQLVENSTDILISQEANIFSSLLAQQLTTIPFYLTNDENKQRRLQAVSPRTPDLAHRVQLWQEMQQQVLSMSQLLNDHPDESDSSPSFGIYCYQDKKGQWKIQADYSFTTAAQKSLFINQALHHKQYAFYHCTLTPIKPTLIEQEGDLNQKMLEFRTHSPHKVKLARKTLHSLFAVGELIDITNIISANYQQ